MWIYSVEDWFVIEGKWHHIVFIIHDSGKAEAYLDGKKWERQENLKHGEI